MGSVNQQAILSQDPLALVIGMDLVSRAGLRLLPPTAGLGDALEGDWGLVGAKWIGSQCLIAATWRPDPALSAESVEKQLQARAKQLSDWLTQRAAAQRAKGTRGLLVVLGGAQPARLAQLQLPPGIGVISVGEQGGVQATGALGRELAQGRDARRWRKAVQRGDVPPSLAAIDLAERQKVHTPHLARQITVRGPLITYVVIGFIVAIWLLEELATHTILTSASDATQAYFLGALGNAAPADTQIWRYVTSIFIHDPADPLHVLLNGIALYFLGLYAERFYGRVAVLSTLVVTGIVANILWVLLTPAGTSGFIVSFGLSGGLCGLAGMLVASGMGRSDSIPKGMAATARQYGILVLVYTVVIGAVLGGVNNTAHLLGFLAGLPFGYFLLPSPTFSMRTRKWLETILLWSPVGIASILLLWGALEVVTTIGSSSPL